MLEDTIPTIKETRINVMEPRMGCNGVCCKLFQNKWFQTNLGIHHPLIEDVSRHVLYLYSNCALISRTEIVFVRTKYIFTDSHLHIVM